MAGSNKQKGLVGLYQRRIGEPDTADEAYGYWVFAVGFLLGIAGIVAFLPSDPASSLRQWSIVLGAAGLALLVAGPVIRLPLQKSANYATVLGLILCGAAIAWFTTVFPADWSTTTGDQTVIVLYAVGIGVLAVGGLLVPMLTSTRSRIAREQAEKRASEAEAAAAEADQRASTAESRASEAESASEESRQRAEAATASATAAEERASEASERAATERSEAREASERAETAESEAREATDRAHRESERANALLIERGDLESELAALRESQAQFEVYEDRGGSYRWRMRHRNGNVIATGGQGYTRKHNAQKGLASVRKNALGAAVVHADQLPEVEAGEEGLEEVPLVPEVVAESRADFEVFEDAGGEYRWRLVHDNGNVIADSGEGYDSKSNAKRAIESVRRTAGPADFLRFDPASFEIFRDAAGQWRWRFVHENGRILGDSGEGYSRRRDARRAVDRIRDNVGDYEFEVYEDRGGKYRWRLVAGNGETVADGGQGYASESSANDAVDRVRTYAPDADRLDMGFAAFEVYHDEGDEWRWRLRHRNGKVLADGGEGYASRSGVHEAIGSVKRNAPEAATESAA
jgi:uncharacterized protein YegP (UPF0339 family)